MTNLPTTKEEAQRQGSATYFTGKSCKHGHISTRVTANATCSECNRLTRKARYRHNAKKDIEYSTKWQKENPERQRESQVKFHKENPGYANQYNRLYATQKWNAVPKWTTAKDVQIVYDKARVLNKKWGTNFQVDHIIPLRSDNVCGLHCPDNLQLLDQPLNGSKGNTFHPDW